MEKEKTEVPRGKGHKDPPESVLFTYYQGDINSVVDEHFYRALNKASIPRDLSRKPGSPQELTAKAHGGPKVKQEFPTSSQWALPNPSWPKTSFQPASVLSQFPPAEEPVASQGVIMSPSGLTTNFWNYPSRQSNSFDHSPMLYSPAGAAEGPADSFLNLLHMDRPLGAIATAPKSEGPDWNSAPGFRDSVGNRISTDPGVQAQERSKNLHWY
ncbi:transcription cofactor vestigial-like protein 1 [Denticeps clupeoides]|uniref:transcription cofactor vestigial-like protein 1 n=1 Tax=Denticeps clupeoides TaxID=299321 RepID=UPI0010A4A41C|nr:transcription cofactor vestigial-like protein 1 [Denticeps clupeoides]